jgi:glycosyltransferase involved in cell wall biosynthesis
VISDNASTDRTREICEDYVKADSRVRYHRNAVNIGLYANFNLLLGLVRTPYVKLASADDFWAPTMLADAMGEMQSDPSLVLCHPRAVLVDEDGRESRRYEKALQLTDDDPCARFQTRADRARALSTSSWASSGPMRSGRCSLSCSSRPRIPCSSPSSAFTAGSWSYRSTSISAASTRNARAGTGNRNRIS